MKFPRKCIECGRRATTRVLFYGKNRPFCDECGKEIRRKGGSVPKTEKPYRILSDSIRKPATEPDLQFSFLTENNFEIFEETITK